MGHGKSDRPFLSAAEHSGVYGAHGASVGKQGGQQQEAAFQSVPYDCCGISFQPWSNPVCSSGSGMVFELTNLIPFVRKFGVHPATGQAFDLDDVVSLHFSKNDAGRYQDPVSFKEFGQHSHIVAVKTTGNVYLHETVQRLNIKCKNMKDLLTEEPFTKSDLIAIQDPNHPETRSPQSLHHVEKGLTLTQADKGIDNTELVNVRATGSASRILAQLQRDPSEQTRATSPTPSSLISIPASSGQAAQTSSALSRNKATGASTGKTGASLTSSTITPRTAIDRVVLDDEEVMFEHLKSKGSKDSKGYVRLTTNFGPLNLELHCDKAPKTCYNFITLCKQGKYDDTVFHRNIPGFMIQGGDPTGTGRGGQSIWNTDFRDESGNPGAFKHTSRGVLSMANKGPGTNGSQFFLTYRAVSHLDGKHTVFGRLVDGEKDKTLTLLEQVPSEQGTDRPLRSIRILDVLVTEDPFERYQLKQQKAAQTHDATDQEYIRRLERKRRREADRTTWLGTELPSKTDNQDADKAASRLLQTTSSIGKYLAATPKSQSNLSSDSRSHKKPKSTNGGFGDFSSW